jgi:hypothetical protein
MTRETKVGLVVAGSFLCLVGVVVASRMGRKAEPGRGPELAQTITPNEPEPADKKVVDKKDPPKPSTDEKNPGVLQVGFDGTGPTVPVVTPPPVPHVPPVAVSPSMPPDLKAPLSDPIAEEQKKKLKALADAKAKETPTLPPAVTIPGKPLDAPPPIPGFNPQEVISPSVPTVPGPIALDQKSDKKIVGPPPPAPDFGNPGNKEPAINPSKIDTSKPPVVDPQIVAVKPKEAAPAAPPVPSNDLPPPASPPSLAGDVAKSGADIKPKTPDPLPPFGNSGTAPAPLAVNKEPTNPTLLPLGAEMKNPMTPVTVPPVTVKSTGGNLPTVTEVVPTTYVCKPDDTSFEAVSTRLFGSPKYAGALHDFNRDHPLAKPNVKQDNPRLLPDQVIFIPTQQYLNARVGASIDNRQGASGTAPAISISPPLNANPASSGTLTSGPTVGRTTSPTIPTKDVTKPYRVPGQGQMLIEIAQQTLGDRGRWSEIYRLNPTLRPEYPVPGGTEIRLPSNANVP